MLSVVIAVEDEEEGLARTLAALVPAVAEGVVRDAIVLDTGGREAIAAIADAAGCHHLTGPVAETLPQAVALAQGHWVMMLEPGVVLEHDWIGEVTKFVEKADADRRTERLCATFTFASQRYGLSARLEDAWRYLRAAFLGRPSASQGLILRKEALRRALSAGEAGAPLPPAPPSGLRLVLLHARAFAGGGA